MQTPEKDILSAFLTKMVAQGASAWAEVVVNGLGTCDAVIHHKNGWYCIEGKATKLSYKLLYQARRWSMMCHHPIAIVPYQPPSEELLLASSHFRENGVAVWMVGQTPYAYSEVVAANFSDIKNYVSDSNKWDGRFAKAGSKTGDGRRATKKNILADDLMAYILENPGCSLADCAKSQGMKAMALDRMIRKGDVLCEKRVETGKTYLWPAK